MNVKPIPEGYHTVTPFLTVPDVEKMLDFVKQAFGATEVDRLTGADGAIRHADVIIGNSHVMLGASSEQWPARPGALYLYVEDVDAWYHNAMAAGGTSLREPTDEFYGDRSAGLTDPQGNQWWIATHMEDLTKEEIQQRAEAAWK
jgi:PhnB protein